MDDNVGTKIFIKQDTKKLVRKQGTENAPFTFEGRRRANNAKDGIEELKKYVDSLIIVSNDNLLDVIGRKPIEEAFQAADNVLRQGVQTISDLIHAEPESSCV